MSRNESKTQFRKNKIADRARRVNTFFLVVFLVLMMFIGAAIVIDINSNASENLVRAYSIEAAERFYANFSQDLTVVRNASHSKAIINWFCSETDEEKRAAAFEEMMSYKNMVQDLHLYFGIHETKNEYTIDGESVLGDLVPIARLNPENLSDVWYFECINSGNEYTLKIDMEKITNTWHLWINHKVMVDGKPAGIFCSGLHIPDVFHNIEDVRGYVIDRYGTIQLASTSMEIYTSENKNRILDECTDPVFAAAYASYEENNNGFFSSDTLPEIIRLKDRPYRFAAISPIRNTDWSVVVFFNSRSLPSAAKILPLLITMLAALVIYMIGRNILMNHLIFRPLHQLTQSVLKEEAVFYGIGYHDEIGELARTIQEMRDGRKRQEQLLHAVNSATAVLLAPMEEKDFEASLLKGMELMGRSMDVDRVQIWQNELIEGDLHFIHKFQWLSETGLHTVPVPINLKFSYRDKPEWESKFSKGEYINGPLSSLQQDDQDFLNFYNIKSIVIIPLFLQNQFWGFFSIDDCRMERTFTNDEINILRSGSLMMASAVNRHAQEARIREAYEHAQVLLNTMPLCCLLWDRQGNIFDCNEEAVKLFKVKDKQEYIDRFMEFSPEYQPDGRHSASWVEVPRKIAFEEGRFVFEWTHQLPDGTIIPVEVTLVRVFYGDEYVLASYARDLREYKQMMKEIERRDYLLNTVNLIAAILLQPETDKFEVDVNRCMGMMAEAVGADRVTIWENSTMENELYCTQIYEWLGNAKSFIGGELTTNINYKTELPGWEETLSQGDCIISLTRDLSLKEQIKLQKHGVKSIFVAPVFVRDVFWGYVGFDDCHSDRVFTDNEITILRSGSLFIANAMLRNDMTRNIQATAMELEAALEKAQEASRAKTDFLAKMSHEMRTPLNAVIGLSELSLESDWLTDDTHASLEKIYNAGMTLLSTVNDVLDISKIEAGKFDLIPVEYDIPSLINDTITQSIMHIGEKPIQFVLDVEEDLPARLFGDDLRVKQILNNLLSNAFKYTKEGTVEMSLHCTREEDSVWVTAMVRDSGRGIRKEDIGDLFTEYAQMDTESNRKIEGTGLGLPIAKKMLEMMDGSILVDSEYGKGSTFTIKFRQRFVTDRGIGAEMANNLKNFRYSDSKRVHHSRLVRIKIPYARVLVVDDVVTNLDVAKGLMKPYGMEIDCVLSGQEAIDAIREEKVKYNAIFMDHMMPKMDGIEATRIIREEIGTDYARNIPIIALTANAIVGNEAMFLSKGFQAFISKPIEIGRLDVVIREWVRDKELEKAFTDQQFFTDEQTDIRRVKERRAVYDRRSGIDRRIIGQMVSGIDVDKGIARFGGDGVSYLKVLSSFAANTRPLLDELKTVNKDNLADYTITVHGIKGASRGICAESVGAKAEALEKAARDGDLNYITANNHVFLETVEKLIDSLDKMLQQTLPENQKPQKDGPDMKILAELLDAARAYDMDGVDAAMAEIERYKYLSDDGLAAWLRENVDQMNLKQIEEKLAVLTGNNGE